MIGRLLLIYAVVELMAVIGLAAAIGFGWTVLVLLAAFVLGLAVWAPMGGWQLSRKFVQVRSGLTDPRSALSDGALVTLATGLVVIPGLVTTAVGLLLLVPPVRAAVRPGLAAIAGRSFQQRIPLITDVPLAGDRRDYIDGEVIDVIDVEPPVLPYGR